MFIFIFTSFIEKDGLGLSKKNRVEVCTLKKRLGLEPTDRCPRSGLSRVSKSFTKREPIASSVSPDVESEPVLLRLCPSSLK